MKKRTLLIFTLIIISMISYAQDYIYLKDGSTIEATVKDVNDWRVIYVNFHNPNGAEYTIQTERILKIVSENGYVKTFDNASNKTEVKAKEKTTKEKDNYFALGIGAGRSYGGIGLRLQARFGKTQGFGIHAGIGYNPTGIDAGCFAVGVKYYYYRWLYANVQAGIINSEENIVNQSMYDADYFDSNYETKYIFGVSILAGADFIFTKHIGLNVAVGPTIANGGVRAGFDLGFVFKF